MGIIVFIVDVRKSSQIWQW